MAQKVVIGTRGSALAMWQANWAQDMLLKKHAGIDVEIRVIKTRGDQLAEAPLAQIGGKEVWTKEIETALLNGQIDLAVHSLKDLPTRLPDGLTLGAVSAREDVRDALVSPKGVRFDKLPRGARLATSSLRRQAQLLYARPDFQIEPIRGNVDTRLKKCETLGLDGVILAAAGLVRLGLQAHVTEYLDPERSLPAPGQAALGIEIRQDDPRMGEMVSVLNDQIAACAVTAERAMLAALGGGCRVPIGGLALCRGNQVALSGVVAMPDGSRLLRVRRDGRADDPEGLGKQVAAVLLKAGAGDILAQLAGE